MRDEVAAIIKLCVGASSRAQANPIPLGLPAPVTTATRFGI
jgi:hypothetical protein